MKVLVTGASGFVGRGMMTRLAQLQGCTVRAAVRTAVSSAQLKTEFLHAPMEFVTVGDLAARPDLSRTMEGITHVIHLAARAHVVRESAANPFMAFRAMNVEGTTHIARAALAAGVRRFIFLSSVKAQGESGMFREGDTPHPIDPYGMSKLDAELKLRAIAAESASSGAMEVVVVRSPLVYGPGVRANFAALIRAVARGVPLPFRMVRNRRSLVARANLVDMLVTVLEHPAAGNQTFGVTDGNDLSTPDLVRRIAGALGRPPRLFPVPVALLSAAFTLIGRQDLSRRLLGSLQLDITKARTLLSWNPPVAVDSALDEMVATWRSGQGR